MRDDPVKDQPDPPKTSQWEVTKVAMKNITIQSAVDEEEHGTILLEVAQFLKLYDMVNARVMLEAVKGAPAVRMYVFADRAGPFTCSEFLGEQLPINRLRFVGNTVLTHRA